MAKRYINTSKLILFIDEKIRNNDAERRAHVANQNFKAEEVLAWYSRGLRDVRELVCGEAGIPIRKKGKVPC